MNRPTLFLLCLFCLSAPVRAQRSYAEAIQMGDAAFRRGEYKTAVDKYFAAEAFDPSKKETVKEKVNAVFDKIERLRGEADKAKRQAEQTARSAYANDLAYKSTIALERGDRNAAFRLAEFAYRYVDATDNPTIVNALAKSFYYNEHPDTLHRLPWAKNIIGHEGILSLAISPDSKKLATGSTDGSVMIWDLATKKAMFGIETGHYSPFRPGVHGIAFSPDGSMFATAGNGGILDDQTAKIWDAQTGRLLATLPGGSKVSFSPDGLYLLSSNKVWDIRSTSNLLTLKAEPPNTGIGGCAFSAAGKIAGYYNAYIKVWGSIFRSDSLLFNYPNREVKQINYYPDGRFLAAQVGYYSVVVLDLETGMELYKFDNGSEIRCFAISTNGTFLATVGTGETKASIWRVDNGKKVFDLTGHPENIIRVEFSPDGKTIITGSSDIVKLWDFENALKPKYEPEDDWLIADMDIAPISRFDSLGGALIATAHASGEIKIFDPYSRIKLKSFFGYRDEYGNGFFSVAFSPDGKSVAAGNKDGTIKIWNLSDGAERVIDSKSGLVADISFSPDGNYLAACSDSMVKIWNFQTGIPLVVLPENTTNDIASDFSPDGKKLATGSLNGAIKIWDVKTASEIFSNSEISEAEYVSDLDFSPDGEYLAAGYPTHVKILNTRTGKNIFTFYNKSFSDLHVSYAPDGKYLAIAGISNSNGENNIIKVFNIKTGKEVFSIDSDEARKVVFFPDGKRMATSWGTFRIWELYPEAIIRLAEKTDRVAEVTVNQLEEFGLDALLDQYPANEQKLVASGEVWQIVYFAERYDHQTRGIGILDRVDPLYARADRLYTAALVLQDERYIRKKHAAMLKRWAELCRDNGQEAKAKDLEARAAKL